MSIETRNAIHATLEVINSKIDRNGDTYRAFTFTDHASGNAVSYSLGGSARGNAQFIRYGYSKPNEWDSGINVIEREYGIREFNRTTKDWPYLHGPTKDYPTQIKAALKAKSAPTASPDECEREENNAIEVAKVYRGTLVISAGDGFANDDAYKIAHNTAVASPREIERPIVSMFAALDLYCRHYANAYDSRVGNDHVLGTDGIGPMFAGLLVLLNGECGRLDCGTVDGRIRKLAAVHGISSKHVEQ